MGVLHHDDYSPYALYKEKDMIFYVFPWWALPMMFSGTSSPVFVKESSQTKMKKGPIEPNRMIE